MLKFLAKHSAVKRLGMFMTTVTALLCLGACTVDNVSVSHGQQKKDGFIAEAQRLFAEQVTRNPATGINEKGMMQPGEMTPVWQMSEMSATETLNAIDVPLLSDYRYRAMFTVGDDAIMVPIYQNLVVVKSSTTGKMAQYLHYYIPDVDYVRRYQGDLTDRFRNCEQRGDYCGLEIYTDMLGKIRRINKFEEGVKTVGLFMGNPDVSPEEKRRVVATLMHGIWIQRGQRSETTRATGSENDDWEWGGRWEYTDKDGNRYIIIDTDGDGNPDSVLIDDVGCDGDNDDNGDNGDDNVPIPEPYPDENNDPPLPPIGGDNTGGGSGGSGNPYANSVDVQYLDSEQQQVFLKLVELLKMNIPIVSQIVARYGALPFGNLARVYTADLYRADANLTCEFLTGFNDRQLAVVLSHEFGHIYLFELTKSAGSLEALQNICPELAALYVDYTDDAGRVNVNDAHHEFLARHPEMLVGWLRELCPDEESSFSNFGRWGSLMDTDAFKRLPKDEKFMIKHYLYNIFRINE